MARTSPSIWDVFIAFFGGMAGMVAASRKERSNVVPGVAIATALMPPLCTAGFGLATGNWYFFLGALYLYFINSVFIAIATFLMARYLEISKKQDIEVLDRAYPNIAIEFLEIEGKFGPEIIDRLSRQWNIPKNFMFIGSPGNKFPYHVSELGGVRLIM